jgi:large subunit ribosomal protein L6
MSRIGNLPVKVPSGVNLTLDGNLIRVKGPKGELSQMYQNTHIAVELRENEAIITRLNDEKPARCYHGLTRTLIANMVEG